ncbi:hypothetical protein BSL78_17551 [Apostichopus japonicus]|uniref:Urocanase Rossmann-like domain-containing protein n=1 Tax=Stichopus japonicus TaxID=307972 RepID=A0A2G8KC49_STIJA|nr:hypothetical protein BSL78_17551 [Apostichopus japonicus]
MSGAQAKAAVICGCVGVIAEVSKAALMKRYDQGWLLEVAEDADACIALIRKGRKDKVPCSIGFHGNIVALWERLAEEYDRTGDVLVDLGSDQTSCHNPFNGGYYPVQLSMEEANRMMVDDPENFKKIVHESLRRHADVINKLTKRGMYFFDYGNAFLLEASRAGGDVMKEGQYRYTV